MNIGVIGLGLIGGSFALAARQHISGCILFGEDCNEEHQKQAIEFCLIDQKLTPSNYAEMDVIILAVPVDAALERAASLLDQMNEDALLMDAGSTKDSICTVLEFIPRGINFWRPILLQEPNFLVLQRLFMIFTKPNLKFYAKRIKPVLIS